ncbi:hypothetical protein NXS19_013410 [Fusarium pseudograminearum]|nr:hypothetical protein NXS19_013410 [Fusarium pseudograminearum]
MMADHPVHFLDGTSNPLNTNRASFHEPASRALMLISPLAFDPLALGLDRHFGWLAHFVLGLHRLWPTPPPSLHDKTYRAIDDGATGLGRPRACVYECESALLSARPSTLL